MSVVEATQPVMRKETLINALERDGSFRNGRKYAKKTKVYKHRSSELKIKCNLYP